ncbi:hydrogenase maturation protease [Candidatus Fermentibacterales bacterium]|nr:hydrogenase maturation protease [Candidatus Fermentibacterales bacterium]
MNLRLVAGLGNPILGDDSIGLRIVERVERIMASAVDPLTGDRIRFMATSLSGFRLLDLLVGYDSLAVIDSITTGAHPTGHMSVWNLCPQSCSSPAPMHGLHHLSITGLLEMGGRMCRGGPAFPSRATVYAIEIERPEVYGTGLSKTLRARLDDLATEVADCEMRRLLSPSFNAPAALEQRSCGAREEP